MSNQRTPNSKRHRRRRDDAPSRNMFVEVHEENEKQNKKFTDIFNKSINETQEENIEVKKVDTRDYRKTNDDSGKGDFKLPNVFQATDRGDSERRIRRNKRNVRTLLFFGISAAVFVAVVIGVIALVSGGKEKQNEDIPVKAEITQNIVTIYYNDDVLEVATNAETVWEVLTENEIVLAEKQQTNFADDAKTYDGMEIFISSPMTVSVIQNEITNSVTVYGGRVSDIFSQMGIELDDYDVVSPQLDALVEDGMKINFTDVEIKEVSVVEDLPYETKEGETDTVEKGYYHVDQEGTEGTVKVTYEVKYVNNEEQSRVEVSREVVVEALDRVILWGTASRSSNGDSSSDGGGDDSSGDDGSYDDVVVNNPGEQATNPSVPAAPSDYVEIFSGHVTAYTHTGNTTATGTWPRSTRTLDNPGSCAVVPGTIPYGSLLYVTGYGYCIAEDTGAFRHDPDRWNQIDLFMNTEDECWTWGRRDDVKVYILRKGY